MNDQKKQLWQAVKFTLFSLSAGILQIGSFAVLELFIKTYWIPYLISLLLSILWNFTLNRRYTFQSAANIPIAMAKVLGFYLVFTPLSTWLGHLAEGAGVHDFLIFIQEEDFAGGFAFLVVDGQDGLAGQGLAAAGLAHQTQSLTLLHLEIHTAHGGQKTFCHTNVHMEVFYFKNIIFTSRALYHKTFSYAIVLRFFTVKFVNFFLNVIEQSQLPE